MTPLKRRQFTKLAAASFTSTVLADFSSKALAQKSLPVKETLYGLNIIRASKSFNQEDQSPSVDLFTADLPTTKLNVLSEVIQPILNITSKINLSVLSVDNPLPVPKLSRALFVSNSDRVTKAIVLADKTLVISAVSHRKRGDFNYLISVVGNGNNNRFRAKKITGLEGSNQTVESILSLPNNELLCLLGTEGIPPYTMKTLNYTTGKVIPNDELSLPVLPLTHRFSHLCQDSKGNIFATEVTSDGVPILISMNLQEKAIVSGRIKIKRLAPLNFEDNYFFNDIKDLAFSSSDQLYALAYNNRRKNNALFRVNMNTGKMELVGDLAAEKVAFSR